MGGSIYPSVNCYRIADVAMYIKNWIHQQRVYVTKLSDALIIQLNIFKYIAGISKKGSTNLSIDEEILPWGNGMLFFGFIYHDWEQSHS